MVNVKKKMQNEWAIYFHFILSIFSNVMVGFHGALIRLKVYYLQLSKQFNQPLKLLKVHCSASIKFYAIAWILLNNVSHPSIYHREWFVHTSKSCYFLYLSLIFICTFLAVLQINNNILKRKKEKTLDNKILHLIYSVEFHIDSNILSMYVTISFFSFFFSAPIFCRFLTILKNICPITW